MELWVTQKRHIHSSLHLLAHIRQILEHRNYSTKICRTEMNLTTFLGFSQVIIKPPTTLGTQMSSNTGVKALLQGFDISHSHIPTVGEMFKTGEHTVYSDYTALYLTQRMAIEQVWKRTKISWRSSNGSQKEIYFNLKHAHSSTLFFFCCIRNEFVGEYQNMTLLNDFFRVASGNLKFTLFLTHHSANIYRASATHEALWEAPLGQKIRYRKYRVTKHWVF